MMTSGAELPFSAVPLLGLLTMVFLVLVIAQEAAGLLEALEPVARIGLVAAGAPWLALSLAQNSGSMTPLWLIPAAYAAAAFVMAGPLRRRLSAWFRKRRTGEWTCLKCGLVNSASSSVCDKCGEWSPDRDRRR